MAQRAVDLLMDGNEAAERKKRESLGFNSQPYSCLNSVIYEHEEFFGWVWQNNERVSVEHKVMTR
jgi:hypothetical protein